MKPTTVMCIAFAVALGASGCSGGSTDDSVLPGVQALVFVKRQFVTPEGGQDVAGGNNQTIDYLRYVPGGALMVLEPPTPDGELRNLTADFPEADVSGVDVSFDARQLAFSMRRDPSDKYHVYLINVDGTGFRQLTFGDHDDVRPIFVPGDRIAFVTNEPYTAMGTRCDEYNHSCVVTQLATISVAGGDADRRLCSQNLSHQADPFLLDDGRVGFASWQHLGSVNDVKLFAMNPDCTQMVALAGQHGKPSNSLVQVEEISAGEYIAVATSRRGTIQAGALVHIDVRTTSGSDLALDEQAARFELLTSAVPTDEESPASGVGRYRRPFPLAGDDFIVSWADGDVNERNELAETAPDFGIYLWNSESKRRTLVYNDPNTWDLYAQPIRARDVPPVRGSTVGAAPDPSTPAVLGSIDITATSLDDRVNGLDGAFLSGMPLPDALGQAKRVRIIEGFSSEIGPVREFGLTMHEGAAILGEVPIYEDGSWEASVPSLLPYHLQPVDEFGLAIRNQQLWIQAMPGESRRCGGCHESRVDTVLPRTGATTLAQQAGPIDLNVPIPDRTELPWYGATTAQNLQDLFDAKCVSCHATGSGSDPFAGRSYTVTTVTEEGEELVFDIPYLDLSSTTAEVYYEMDLVEYPLSYITLLYPSAMMGDSVATGDVPPLWVVPGAARESQLIAGVNVNSEEDESRWAWADRPAHPEDVGVELTREERLMLVRMADLGGQYYSRKNVAGADSWEETEY